MATSLSKYPFVSSQILYRASSAPSSAFGSFDASKFSAINCHNCGVDCHPFCRMHIANAVPTTRLTILDGCVMLPVSASRMNDSCGSSLNCHVVFKLFFSKSPRGLPNVVPVRPSPLHKISAKYELKSGEFRALLQSLVHHSSGPRSAGCTPARAARPARRPPERAPTSSSSSFYYYYYSFIISIVISIPEESSLKVFCLRRRRRRGKSSSSSVVFLFFFVVVFDVVVVRILLLLLPFIEKFHHRDVSLFFHRSIDRLFFFRFFFQSTQKRMKEERKKERGNSMKKKKKKKNFFVSRKRCSIFHIGDTIGEKTTTLVQQHTHTHTHIFTFLQRPHKNKKREKKRKRERERERERER